MEDKKIEEAERQEEKEKLERKSKSIKLFFTGYLSIGMMEVPVLVALLLWTIFLALRSDDYILWNYHLVFLPIYIGLAQVFCGLFTTDVVYGYLRKNKNKHNQYTMPSFSAKSTATLIYKEMTPIWKYIRRKSATYIWWMTVTAFFVLLAETLNEDGLFGAEWCLVAVLVGLVVLAGCFFSWKPSGDLCSEDKVIATVTLSALIPIVSWIVIFIWTKWEFLADFSWYSTFSPWWIIAILSFFLLFFSWVMYLTHLDSSDFKLFTGMIITATVAFATISAFLVLLAYNLEALYVDKPIYPWIVVAIPIIIFEVYSIVGCFGLFIYVQFFK